VKQYDKETGMRLTDCCGAASTFHDADLVCKTCQQSVGTGEGDGSEYGRRCAAPGCRKPAHRSGSGKGYCPTCYQRARRLERGGGKLGPGEVPESPISRSVGGARELRALCPAEVVMALKAQAITAGLSTAEYVRRVMAFVAGLGADPRPRGGTSGRREAPGPTIAQPEE